MKGGNHIRQQILIPLAGNTPIKIRYGKESVSPETYYDYIHDHHFLEVCLIISGKMLHFASGKTYSLKFGDVFFCRSRELHYALAAEASVYERYAFWLPMNAFSWLEGGDDAALGVFSDSRYSDTNVLRIRPGSEERYLKILEELKKCISSDSGIAPLCVVGKLAELLVFINNEAGCPDDLLNEKPQQMPALIFNIIRYVRQNYRTISGIDEVAANFYTNKDYMTRVFKRHTGFTVHDYLRSVRISKSKILLKKGKGVTETAFSCGFNSTSYFIRVFEKATGLTPSKYRASGKEIIENKE